MIHEKGRLDDCPLGSVHGTGSLKHSRMTVLVSSFQSVKSFNKLNLEFLFPKYSPDPGSCVLVLCFSVFSQRLYWKAVLFYRCKCVRSLRRGWDQPCFENYVARWMSTLTIDNVLIVYWCRYFTIWWYTGFFSLKINTREKIFQG